MSRHLRMTLHFFAWSQRVRFDSLHQFLPMRLNYDPKSSISPESAVGLELWCIAIAAIALDLHRLSRSYSKSTPRARSFRERAEVCVLCVSGACAFDAPVSLFSHHEHAERRSWNGSSAKAC